MIGWGCNEESWLIDYVVIEGDLESVELWLKVDVYLKCIWWCVDGYGFEVMVVCIDFGGYYI